GKSPVDALHHDGWPEPSGFATGGLREGRGMRYAGRVFGLAAIFNVGLGTSALLAPAFTARLMGIDVPDNRLFMDLAMWLVLVLGIGYGLAAAHHHPGSAVALRRRWRAPAANRAVGMTPLYPADQLRGDVADVRE